MKPTKIALITDAHGNMPALQVALAAVKDEKCDAIYHLGDAISIGPFPAECLDLILETPNLTCIIGNHEQYFLQGIPSPKPKYMSDGEVLHLKWVHNQLGEKRKHSIAQWETETKLEIRGVKVCFQHYAFSGKNQQFARTIRDPSTSDLDQLFENIDAEIVFYGHAHKASDKKGKKRYINPGSLGCNPKSIAKYSIAKFENGNVNIFHRAIPYDDVELFRAFEERSVPDREFIYKNFFGGRFKDYET